MSTETINAHPVGRNQCIRSIGKQSYGSFLLAVYEEGVLDDDEQIDDSANLIQHVSPDRLREPT